MELEAYLDQKIKEICPIHGISFKDLADKRTWRLDFKDEATDQQKADARAYIQSFDWATEQANAKMISLKDELRSNKVYRKQFADYKAANADGTLDTFADYINSIKVQ